jgi:hypothetical protein
MARAASRDGCVVIVTLESQASSDPARLEAMCGTRTRYGYRTGAHDWQLERPHTVE